MHQILQLFHNVDKMNKHTWLGNQIITTVFKLLNSNPWGVTWLSLGKGRAAQKSKRYPYLYQIPKNVYQK